MQVDQDAQDVGRGFGRVRVHGDDLAALATAGHLELRLAGPDDTAQPAQLLLRFELVHVEVGAKPAVVEWHPCLERERLDRGEIDNQNLRVIEVAAGKLAQHEWPLRLRLELAHHPLVGEKARAIGRDHLHVAAGQARAIGHQCRVLLDIEELACSVGRAVYQRVTPVAFESVLGDQA